MAAMQCVSLHRRCSLINPNTTFEIQFAVINSLNVKVVLKSFTPANARLFLMRAGGTGI